MLETLHCFVAVLVLLVAYYSSSSEGKPHHTKAGGNETSWPGGMTQLLLTK
jgi:hypothetical protein